MSTRVGQVCVVFVLLLLGFSVGRATETLTEDAAWWRDLSSHDQTVAVIGLVEGYSEGYSSGHAAGVLALFQTLSLKSGQTLLTDGRYLNALSAGGADFTKTFGTYTNQITDFYQNYPSLTDLPVGRIMQCMKDHPAQSCDDFAAGVIKARAKSN